MYLAINNPVEYIHDKNNNNNNMVLYKNRTDLTPLYELLFTTRSLVFQHNTVP